MQKWHKICKHSMELRSTDHFQRIRKMHQIGHLLKNSKTCTPLSIHTPFEQSTSWRMPFAPPGGRQGCCHRHHGPWMGRRCKRCMQRSGPGLAARRGLRLRGHARPLPVARHGRRVLLRHRLRAGEGGECSQVRGRVKRKRKLGERVPPPAQGYHHLLPGGTLGGGVRATTFWDQLWAKKIFSAARPEKAPNGQSPPQGRAKGTTRPLEEPRGGRGSGGSTHPPPPQTPSGPKLEESLVQTPQPPPTSLC